MKKLNAFLLVLLLSLSVLSAQTYYITEEQLTALDKELQTQKELAAKFQIKSDQLSSQAMILENQLQASQKNLQECQKALAKAHESLTASENKKFKTNIKIGVISLGSGLIIGTLAGIFIVK